MVAVNKRPRQGNAVYSKAAVLRRREFFRNIRHEECLRLHDGELLRSSLPWAELAQSLKSWQLAPVPRSMAAFMHNVKCHDNEGST